MPIEVRELVIKAVVVSDSDDSLRDTSDIYRSESDMNLSSITVSEVVKQVIEVLKERDVR